MNKQKLAIIGASYLQMPLIEKAKELGCETHVFAWECGDPGEAEADYFYPISIREKELILEKCREIGIDGICSIASDLANITVSYVGNALGLSVNPIDVVERTTDKALMRKSFEINGDPSPASILVRDGESVDIARLKPPIIVKPTDRSGSRGVTRLKNFDELEEALLVAFDQSFSKQAVVEEFIVGKEYSVETISWNGNHSVLAITEKFTTGSPHYIEVAHLEPARLDLSIEEKIKSIVKTALTNLGVLFGASHSEIIVDDNGQTWIVEIGSRMGGDLIGSHLVELSTGYDFLKAVVDVALGKEPDSFHPSCERSAMVRYFFEVDDVNKFVSVLNSKPNQVVFSSPIKGDSDSVTDSSTRLGCYVLTADSASELLDYLPNKL